MRVIGLISGTSVDGIDAALVEISGSAYDLTVTLLAGATYPYPSALRDQILAVCGGATLSMADLADLDDAIAHQFAQAALQIEQGQPPAVLIGSHGQTVFHRPVGESTDRFHQSGNRHQPAALGYSLQLGRGAVIAQHTGITTVNNFRAADIAAGGQGAPMVSAIDVALLSHATDDRCVQNIGGIGNVTYLPARDRVLGAKQPSASVLPSVIGWDTGPGNVLIDLAVAEFTQGEKTYDQDGAWAASGTPCQTLVTQWLQQDFFQQLPPKSTGRELFGQAYLHRCLVEAESQALTPADLLATLTEFTAASIADNYRRFLPQMPDQVLICGGGSKNQYLLRRIQAQLKTVSILTTDAVGLSADYKEAIAFAVLAYWRQQGFPGNLPTVTGATKAVLLGDIYQGGESGA